MRILTRRRLKGALLVAAAVAGAELLGASGWFDGYERAFYDTWHNLAGQRRAPAHAALVLVDDDTLYELREEPQMFWGPHFARALSTLHQVGVRAVGLDFLFQVSAESWLARLDLVADQVSRTYDAPFRAQLAGGRVVLAGWLDAAGRPLLPVDDYLMVLPGREADVGLAELLDDPDGAVRHFAPSLFDRGPPPRVTFAALLALKASGLDPRADSWQLGGRTVVNAPEPLAIGYLGPPGTFEPVSFARLLAEDAATDSRVRALAGKVVIVGAGHAGTQDVHLTPYALGLGGGHGRLMNGSELHANIVETLLSGRAPRPVPVPLRLLIEFVLIGLAGVLFLHLRPVPGAGCALLAAGLFCAVAFLLFGRDLRLPVGGAHAGLALAYLASLGLRLTGEERRRTRMQRLFGKYVSDGVVERLLQSSHDPDLGGEARTVTVLFSDIRSFTTISERLSAQEVVEMLNAYFSRVCDAILEQEGTIDKFVGDAVMAVFGSPHTSSDHARQAVRAALAMRDIAGQFAEWMRARFADRGLPRFEVGIGVHTGDAVVGNIGSTRRLEFTAIGDTVNTASRLEGITKKLGVRIAISAQTVAAAGSGLQLGKSDRVVVKGRQEEVEVHELVGLEEEDHG